MSPSLLFGSYKTKGFIIKQRREGDCVCVYFTYQSQKEVSGAVKLFPVSLLSKLCHLLLEKIKSNTFSF